MSEKPKAKPVKGTTRLTMDLDAIVAAAGEGDWRSVRANEISGITKRPGVYLFTLPEKDRHGHGRLTLYGRTFGAKGMRRQLQIEFAYAAQKLEGTSQLILYAGKAANLRDRLKNHLNLREDSTTSQMLSGLASQAVHHGEERNVAAALAHLLAEATIYYYELGHAHECDRDPREDDEVGESLTADRDLLEIKLIAKYAPPFNIKAER